MSRQQLKHRECLILDNSKDNVSVPPHVTVAKQKEASVRSLKY